MIPRILLTILTIAGVATPRKHRHHHGEPEPKFSTNQGDEYNVDTFFNEAFPAEKVPGKLRRPPLDLESLLAENRRSLISEEVDIVRPTALPWPVKKEAVFEGDLILGGLMMVHEREDSVVCGPIMPQGGIQALETMLYTLDVINNSTLLPKITLGAHVLDDCDKDTYGLEMAVDFIKGKFLCNKEIGKLKIVLSDFLTPFGGVTLKNDLRLRTKRKS